MGITLPIAIEKVEFFGVVRIVFGPLCDWWPSFSAMQVAFIGKPTINFNLRLIGGDITAFPFIEKLLTNLIKNVLVNLMVWPNKLDIGITNDLGAKSVSNSGIVRICVKRALHLPQVDRLKSASKMRPAVELIVTDGEYGRAKVIRYLAFPNSKSRLPVCRLPRVPDCTARLWRPDYG
jgi:Ca2+-dependent lipid-binding protein